MDKVFFEELNLPEPAFALNVGSFPREEQLRLMQKKIEPILMGEAPDLVLILGDTNSTLAGARAAKKAGVPLMHIEAGCRSFNSMMPEEMNRIEVDGLSHYLIAPDAVAVENLQNEKHDSQKIYHHGSTVYDAVLRNKHLMNIVPLDKTGLVQDGFVLMTIHRAENTEEPNFTQIMGAIKIIAESETIVFPVHPRTKKIIEEKKVFFGERVRLMEPQPYLYFLALLSGCKFCITDSGGVQEEAVALNKPCLIPRNETEWMRPIYDGKNILAGTKTEKIISAYDSFFNDGKFRRLQEHKHEFYVGASRDIIALIRTIVVHPTAEVSAQARLGKRVKVWHHSQIREGAVIGDDSTLGKNVYVDKNVTIGASCKIQNNSSIYHGVTLENGVFIGPHCVLTNDNHPRAISRNGKLKTDADWTEGKILVREGASLGARVVVLPDIAIGKFALVGAGSVVTKDVPDFGLVYGNPARLQGYVCYCGQKLEEGKNGGDNCQACETRTATPKISSDKP